MYIATDTQTGILSVNLHLAAILFFSDVIALLLLKLLLLNALFVPLLSVNL